MAEYVEQEDVSWTDMRTQWKSNWFFWFPYRGYQTGLAEREGEGGVGVGGGG